MNAFSNTWSSGQRRGFIIAREFVILQFYIWGSIAISAFTFIVVHDGRDSKLNDALIIGTIAFLFTYFSIQYIRVVYAAWQIWTGRVAPPEISAEQEKDQIKTMQDALAKLSDSAS